MNVRFIPTSVHGTIDHVIGPALFVAPAVLRLRRTSPESIAPRIVGGVQAVYSNLTEYELSLKSAVPLRVHLALDGIGGAALALVPQVTGARKRGVKHWLPHLSIGAFEVVGMAVLTEPEPPKPQSTRKKNVAKLVATVKLARGQARRVADAVA
jgi:hypothetical protein